MNLSEIKDKPISELVDIASELGLEDLGRLKKQEIIFRIFKHKASEGTDIYGGGVLEILNDGFGFLRSPQGSYCAGEDDIYVSPSQIRKFGLRKGDSVEGKIRTPKDKERYFALIQVDTINGEEPAKTKNKILFENLTPLFPTERLMLEQGQKFGSPMLMTNIWSQLMQASEEAGYGEKDVTSFIEILRGMAGLKSRID